MTERRVAAAKNMAVRQRNYRRARDRALVQLAQLYPETYTQLLEREKANDEAQGRKWIDIDGTTNAPIASVSAGQFTTGQSSNLSSYTSNNGGEA
jgi:hypothetical protein